MTMSGPLPASTRRLIEQLAEGPASGSLTLGEILDRFSERSFGVLLLLVLLPCFIPLPFGVGGVSGTLVALIGLQVLLRIEHPWLPGWFARRPIQRATLIRFRDRMSRWLERLERLTRPRDEILFEHPLAHAFTGLMLLVLGVALALPLPLTNYPFGLILLAYAFALIERDGRLLAIGWLFGLVEIVVVIGLSGSLASWLGAVFR